MAAVKSRLAPLRVPTRGAVLLVRCALASVAMVMSLLDKDLFISVILGFLIWRWKGELQQLGERQSETARTQIYAVELQKWRGLMALCAVVSVVCFSVVLAKGEDFNFAINYLSILLAVGYWLFDRARALVWLTCYFSVVAVAVALFKAFEISLR